MTNRAIVGNGTPEADWLTWLSAQKIPRITSLQLCGDKNRLVAVAPHPDDEVLACGGLLAQRASRGLRNLIIAVTDGEASHGQATPNTAGILRKRRVLERRKGLALLGVASESIVRLKIPDGKAVSNSREILDRLQCLLQPGDVVVSTWSLDGHPDHEACGKAVGNAGHQHFQAPVWMWHWASPGDRRVPWASLVALELTANTVKLKQSALAQHRSQLEARGIALGPVLEKSIVQRAARHQEYFFMDST